MRSCDQGKLGDVDGDGDFDAVDYAVMEEVEKDAQRRGVGNKNNQGCLLLLLIPTVALGAKVLRLFIY